MHIRIQDSAHNDIREGYWFYERKGIGLGDYFSDTLYGEMAGNLDWKTDLK